MNYKNITVAGTGVLGSQIAYQTAYEGFHVNVYDVSETRTPALRARALYEIADNCTTAMVSRVRKGRD